MLNELLKSAIFKQNPTDPSTEHSHAYLHDQNEVGRKQRHGAVRDSDVIGQAKSVVRVRTWSDVGSK